MEKTLITSFLKYALVCSLLLTITSLAQSPSVLKELFKNNFLIGAALNEDQFFERDKREAEIVKYQFNTITPENVLKWEHVHPELNTYNFVPTDTYVQFGEKNKMFIIGHTLVWHNQTPNWVFEDSTGKQLTKEKLLERMRDHIFTVVGRYKGRVKGWDVVNEAIIDDGSYIQSKWMKIIGEEYVVKAFQYAHEADPRAELYYNDFSVENIPKRNGVISLVKKLQAAGATISGVGLQGHYLLNWPSQGLLDSTIKAFSQLGVKVMITELDIDVLPTSDRLLSAEITRSFQYQEKLNPYKAGLPDSVQQSLAKRYGELFEVFKNNSDKLQRVTFWGVTDGSSWLNTYPIRGRTNYPLLFDREGKPKPAFDTVVKKGIKNNF